MTPSLYCKLLRRGINPLFIFMSPAPSPVLLNVCHGLLCARHFYRDLILICEQEWQTLGSLGIYILKGMGVRWGGWYLSHSKHPGQRACTKGVNGPVECREDKQPAQEVATLPTKTHAPMELPDGLCLHECLGGLSEDKPPPRPRATPGGCTDSSFQQNTHRWTSASSCSFSPGYAQEAQAALFRNR